MTPGSYPERAAPEEGCTLGQGEADQVDSGREGHGTTGQTAGRGGQRGAMDGRHGAPGPDSHLASWTATLHRSWRPSAWPWPGRGPAPGARGVAGNLSLAIALRGGDPRGHAPGPGDVNTR